MAKIRFSSGEIYESASPVSVYEAARELGIISREVISASVNRVNTELSTVVSKDADVTQIGRAHV